MAEFAEVMRQARRLCEMEECRKCPLYNFSTGDCMMTLDYSCETDVDYAEAEKIITQWAEEHPKPVYPSWNEGWRQLFPDAAHIPCPEIYFGAKCNKTDEKYCFACQHYNPIPAEIAKKLGIKPKEQS